MKKRLLAFKNAFKGLAFFFSEGVHPKVHLVAALVVIGAGLFFGLSRFEWIAILLCISLVLSLEALNSAIEYLTDLVSPQYHELAGKTKDVAAAAVFISALFSVIIALIIFIPKFPSL